MIFFDSRKHHLKHPLSSAFASAWVLAAFSLLALQSCGRDATPRSMDGGDATFYVVENSISAPVSVPKPANTTWSINTLNSMTIKACLKDVGRENPVRFQDFSIVGDEGNTQVIKSDNDGCLKWNENIQFDSTKPETYITVKRTITGMGAFRGTRTVTLAIDPWSNSSSAAQDYSFFTNNTKVDVVDARLQSNSVMKALSSINVVEERKATIRAQKFNFKLDDFRYQNDVGTAHANFSFQVKMDTAALGQNLEPIDFQKGVLRLTFQLFQKIPAQTDAENALLRDQTLVAYSTPQVHEFAFDGGEVPNKNFLVNLIGQPVQGAQLQVVYKLEQPRESSTGELNIAPEALNTPFQLLPFYGLKTFAGPQAANDPDRLYRNEYESYLSQSAHDTESRMMLKTRAKLEQMRAEQTDESKGIIPQAACRDGSEDHPFFIQSIDVENVDVTNRSEYDNFPKQIKASYTVCLGTSADRSKPVADKDFMVELLNDKGASSGPQVVPSRNGCLMFGENVNFNYFAPERWMYKTLRVTSTDGIYENSTLEYPLWIDPWRTGKFGWECRLGPPPSVETQPASLEMTEFNYTFNGRETQIDSELNLTLMRHYIIRIKPQLKRITIDGKPEYKSIGDGRYHLRFVLMSPNQDEALSRLTTMDTDAVMKNFTYVSSFEKDITTRDGAIAEEIVLPIPFSETPVLISRAAAIIQLLPTDPDSPLVSVPFFSPMLPMEPSGWLTLLKGQADSHDTKLVANNVDLTKIIDHGQKVRADAAMKGAPLENYALQFGLTKLTPDLLASSGLTETALEPFFDSRKRLSFATAKKLCQLLGEKTADVPVASPVAAKLPAGAAKSKTKTPISVATCATRPMDALAVATMTHIEGIEGNAHEESFEPLQINIAAALASSENDSVVHQGGVSNNRGNNINNTKDHKVSTDITSNQSIGLPSFSPINFGAKTDQSIGDSATHGSSWFASTTSYTNESVAKQYAHTGTGTMTEQRSFGVEQLNFSVQAGTRECAVVRTTQAIKEGKTTGGLMYCKSGPTDVKTVHESYYLISELFAQHAAISRDPYSSTEAPFTKAMRGKKAFESLKKVLQDESKMLIFSSSEADTNELMTIDKTVNGIVIKHPRFTDGGFPSIIY